jgi:hypothetical protein
MMLETATPRGIILEPGKEAVPGENLYGYIESDELRQRIIAFAAQLGPC